MGDGGDGQGSQCLHTRALMLGIPSQSPCRNEGSRPPAAGSISSVQSPAASSLPEMLQLKSYFAQGDGPPLGWLHTQLDAEGNLQEEERGKIGQKWHWVHDWQFL